MIVFVKGNALPTQGNHIWILRVKCWRLVLNAGNGLVALKGHGFSHAAKQPEASWVSAPEGRFETIQYIPQRLKPAKRTPRSARLKPCPFKTTQRFKSNCSAPQHEAKMNGHRGFALDRPVDAPRARRFRQMPMPPGALPLERAPGGIR